MAYADLREFLRRLEKAGELTRVYKPVDRDLELSAVIRCAGEQTVLCEREQGYSMRVVANVFRHPRSVAFALETEPSRALWEFIERARQPTAGA